MLSAVANRRSARARIPPGPRWPQIVQTVAWVKRPTRFLRYCSRAYGDLFTVRMLDLGRAVITTDPAIIKQVFTGDPAQLHAGEAAEVLEPVLGSDSILLLDDEAHLRQRRLLLPPFHGARMKTYTDVMRDITERVIAAWPVKTGFSLHAHFQEITLEVILRTVFGMQDGAQMGRLRDQLTTMMDVGVRQSMLMFLRLEVGARKTFLRELETTNAMLYEEIAQRRRTDLSERTDVLSMMMTAVDDDGQGLSDKELRDELVTLLIAGHETTATSLSWAFERILRDFDVHRRLRDEVDAVVGDARLDHEHIAKLVYLDATIKETMRLRPVIPLVGRKLTRPMQVRDYEIPAGTVIGPSIYLTHRRPDIYPDPERFMPERFVDRKIDPYTYFPFGGGMRRCIGMAFAMHEMKVVLATVLLRYKLTLGVGSSDRIVRRGITFAPEGGVRVMARRR